MFDINILPKTFLGANSAEGFVSYFRDSYDADEGFKAYIIKGGPGTGKSSMMKQLAALFADRGERVEICPCSSDPESLDAVIFHNKKVVIMDGTSPHTVDPAYPGVCEAIVNLSDCWKKDSFDAHRAEILALTRKNKELHARASRYIKAAGSLIDDIYRISLDSTDTQRTAEFAQKIASRLISQGTHAKEHKRFLSGVTPQGLVFFKNTVQKYADTIIGIEDEFGVVSNVMLSVIREMALSSNREIYTCYNTITVNRIDHIIIPELSLAFCRKNRLTHPEGITRHIHARRFMSAADMGAVKNRINFSKHASDELLREAISIIADAKRVHDELEAYYINAMDFSLVGELTQKIAYEIEKR